MKIIGLTGGTGSGKTEVARCFSEKGIPVIDADGIGHKLIEPNGLAEQEVIRTFGKNIKSGNSIDRSKLGAIVFADPPALQELNSITRPLIIEEIKRQCGDLEKAGHGVVVTDAAILADNTKECWLDSLIVVRASREQQCRRLVSDRGMTESEAYRRIDSQVPIEMKLQYADWTINNDGTVGDLRTKVQHIIEELNNGE